MTDIISEIERLFLRYGHNAYGEGCTQYQHMAQCGWWAEQKGYSEPLQAAAFLHDIGHLIADDLALPERDQWGYAKHDELGASWLKQHGVSAQIWQPIALHVQAKRYLVATDKAYAVKLSVASQITLSQQGGPFNQEECQHFAASPAFNDTLLLRGLDELGKAETFELPPLDYWLEKLRPILA